MNLVQRSIDIIKAGQSPSGGYVASPNFGEYAYSWLRDGSFIAYSMLVKGETDSVAAFLTWTAKAVQSQQKKIEALKEAAAAGPLQEIAPEFQLPTRFSLDGEEVKDDWPNFQIDGYGAWLWLLAEWDSRGFAVQDLWRESAALTTDYLAICWPHSCYDCWEEGGDSVHLSTLACVAGGLKAIASIAAVPEGLLETIEARIREGVVDGGYFAKSFGRNDVDSALLWLSVPFGVIPPQDAAMEATAEKIRQELLEEGGVKRYLADTYYGGGLWVLLTGYLAWFEMARGNREEALRLKQWMAEQATEDGSLPEQVTRHVNDATYVEEWIERWGPIATPLLWSHALYLVVDELVH